MRLLLSFIIGIIFINNFGCANKNRSSSEDLLSPPVAKKIPFTDDFHADPRVDNYRWMHDSEDPEVVQHLEKENEYKEKYLSKNSALVEKLFKRMTHFREKKVSRQVSFHSKNVISKEKNSNENYYRWYSTLRESGEKKLLFDGNEWSQSFPYFEVIEVVPNVSETQYLVALDTLGRGAFDLFLLDQETREITQLNREKIWSSFAWINDQDLLFFGTDDELGVHQLYKYNVQSQDRQQMHSFANVYDGHQRSIYKSTDQDQIFINLFTQVDNTIFKFDSLRNDVELINDHEGNVIEEVQWIDGSYFKVSNKSYVEKAIYKKDSRGSWVQLYRPSVGSIGNVAWSDEFAFITVNVEGLHSLEILNLETQEIRSVDTPDELIMISDLTVDQYSKQIFYIVSTYTSPKTQFKCSYLNCSPVQLSSEDQRGSQFISRRIYIESADGEKIPVSLIHKKGKEDAPQRLYLTAYGSYGALLPIRYLRNYIQMLELGFTVAIAHVRGGGAKGKKWYDAGRVFNKMNTFNDFIDVSEGLIAKGYTTSDLLTIEGVSAGGLLVGSVLNMRPDLYKVAILNVPFVDVLNTMTLYYDPLAKYEKNEWGDGLVQDQYEYIKSYDPYTNIKKQKYPSLYVMTGFEDTSVYYFQPMKWVAKMRELNPHQESKPMLFSTTFDGGHGGASSEDRSDRRWAEVIAFIITETENP